MTSTDHALWEWGGESGELPPFAEVGVESLRRDLAAAIDRWQETLDAVVSDPSPPTFANTIEVLEFGRLHLDRIKELLQLHVTLLSTDEITALFAEFAPRLSQVEDAALLNRGLFGRVEKVRHGAEFRRLDPDQQRLTEVLLERLERAGAKLDDRDRARLSELNAELTGAIARFQSNIAAEEAERIVLASDAGELAGIEPQLVEAARALAEERGHAGGWAFACQRATVMAVLAGATSRSLRERVWRSWMSRCDEPGDHDNRPVMAEILQLRTEKAQLLGYPDFAHYALSDRMLRTPEAVIQLLLETWDRVLPVTERQLEDLAELARADGLNETLQPWDRYYYGEQLRRQRFGVDASELRPYLSVDAVLGAALEAASRLHGLEFFPEDASGTYHRDVQLFSVERDGRLIGMLHVDAVGRPGKRGGSWQQPLQPFSGAGSVPVSVVVTSAAPGSGDQPALLSWAQAVVLFHELGHALHMLLARSRFPSLGSMAVPWDAIELPALLNERWIEDRNLLKRHLKHWRTREPISDELIEGVFAAARHDRVFSVTLDYLVGAIIDMKLHQLDDGAIPDPSVIERQTLQMLRMPEAVDQTMRPPHFFHIFSQGYAAGVYSYLLGDAMAAEVAENFLAAKGGFYDDATAARWRDTILSRGAAVPMDQAFQEFSGGSPRSDALFRRFALQEASS